MIGLRSAPAIGANGQQALTFDCGCFGTRLTGSGLIRQVYTCLDHRGELRRMTLDVPGFRWVDSVLVHEDAR